MKGKKTYIINLGGSLIVPDDINVEFLKEFKELILKHVKEEEKRFVFITGGGITARHYSEAAQEITSDIEDEDKDWLGIHATRLNAHLIRTIFRNYAHPRINKNPHDLEDFFQCKEPIMIAAGWRPGFSTDYDTVLLARYLNIKKVVNLSNIDYVYDKDPAKNPDAKKLEELTWEEFQEISTGSWSPGMNVPFDPSAAEYAKKEDLEAVTLNGANLENLDAYLYNRKFEGTLIKNN
ncbi:MAG: UMP kinase [Patescibacteria group bacterium]